jgi:hypothetical protein
VRTVVLGQREIPSEQVRRHNLFLDEKQERSALPSPMLACVDGAEGGFRKQQIAISAASNPGVLPCS